MDFNHLEASKPKPKPAMHTGFVHYPKGIWLVAKKKMKREGWPNFSMLARCLLEAWVRGDIDIEHPMVPYVPKKGKKVEHPLTYKELEKARRR